MHFILSLSSALLADSRLECCVPALLMCVKPALHSYLYFTQYFRLSFLFCPLWLDSVTPRNTALLTLTGLV